MRAAAWIGAALLGACTVQPQPAPTGPAASGVSPPAAARFTPTVFAAIAGWGDDRAAAALPPFRAGCAAMSSHTTLGGQGIAARRGGDPADWRAACVAARAVPVGDQAAARSFFETWFQPFAIADSEGRADGLFTGYHEPEVRGAIAPGGIYTAPLLSRPADIVEADLGSFAPDLHGRSLSGRVEGSRFVPYYDREAIEDGALAGRRLELLWLDDPVDAFFLEIQGSGRVRLPDGGVVRVTYAGQNGRPYVPIGRVLIERGALRREDVSLQSIRAWLVAHPDQARSVMDQNPSYVFFRELRGVAEDQGPPGALGAALTPGRSLAVDRAVIPLGAPVWLDTVDPLDGTKIRRLMLAQDTGGAIKGAVRGDVFWGWGADAEARAGRMKSPGTATLLLPRAAQATAAR